MSATAPAPATRELISDAQEAMVESFVTGLLTCPEPYFDAFVDSWIEGHPESRTLLFVAYMTKDLVERFHKVGHACLSQESA